MVGGGLDNASRILTAQREQYLKIPLHTLWMNQSEQQCMCLQGLGNKLAFEVVCCSFVFIVTNKVQDFEPSINIVQQDNTGALVSPTSESAFFSTSQWGIDCRLGIEYVHVTTSERDAVVAMYRQVR
jgi:hypothetical protein